MEKLFWIILVGMTVSLANGDHVESLGRVIAGGKDVLIPVKKELLQQKIDASYAPALFIPEEVFPNQPAGTHPILVEIADIIFVNLDENDETPKNLGRFPRRLEITISIPFLSVTPGGSTDYSLGMVVLYERTLQTYPALNFLYEYQPVDDIYVDEEILVVTDGPDILRISLATPPMCNHEVKGENGCHTFTPRGNPNFNFCRPRSFKNFHFCQASGRIQSSLNAEVPNVCTTWKTNEGVRCETYATFFYASGIFHDLIPVDYPTRGVAAYQFYGDYSIGVDYPCI